MSIKYVSQAIGSLVCGNKAPECETGGEGDRTAGPRRRREEREEEREAGEGVATCPLSNMSYGDRERQLLRGDIRAFFVVVDKPCKEWRAWSMDTPGERGQVPLRRCCECLNLSFSVYSNDM